MQRHIGVSCSGMSFSGLQCTVVPCSPGSCIAVSRTRMPLSELQYTTVSWIPLSSIAVPCSGKSFRGFNVLESHVVQCHAEE